MLVQEDINAGMKAGAQGTEGNPGKLQQAMGTGGTPKESQLEPLTQTVLKGYTHRLENDTQDHKCLGNHQVLISVYR